jgi:glycolate oxidase FAD binding subunit
MISPSTVEEAAVALKDLQQPVRPLGTGSRAGWGGPDPADTLALSTSGLNQILEHNPGDFTAVFQAGVRLADAQAALAAEGQWIAVDPPEPSGTIGGLVATADSGPARHRYGGVRDLIIGITVVLSDGTVASAGGKVIKNVAGYDLGKLFTGSFGTLGLIATVAFRLHPRPARTVTVSATTADPATLRQVAIDLAGQPLEAQSLDAWWHEDRGGVHLRFGGVAAAEQAQRALPLVGRLSEVSMLDDDEALWAEQRSAQRRSDGAVLKVSGRITDLATMAEAARAAGARLTSRAGLGVSWVTFADSADLDERVSLVRRAAHPRPATLLDGADRLSNPWPDRPPAVVAVMRRVKARFDPAGIFRPGTFGGGL